MRSCSGTLSREKVRILLRITFIVSCFFLFFVAIIHIINYKHIKKLQNTHALYLPTHLFVLIDEAAQRGVLVANLPPLVDDDSHEHQHDHYHSGGEGYTEDDFYFHTLCVFCVRVQGRCKPNAESSLFAEAQPVLAVDS